jgi:probable HAF family extracellular repeat protein
MKTFIRFNSRPTRRWVGVAALLLGSGAAALPQSPGTAGAVAATRMPGFQAATGQAMAQAEAQAAHFDVQSGQRAPCSPKHQHGLRYSVQPLEVPGGLEAYPNAINNRGWVVGYSAPLGSVLPTLWIGGRAFNLGSLGGNVGYAYDINDAGRIVGAANDANGVMRAYTWYRGQITRLPSLGGNTAAYSLALGINAAGVIAGENAVPEAFAVRAVLWRKGVPRALESLSGSFASANKINDLGYSVGTSNLADATVHAALWSPKGNIVDLGAQAVALDINNSGRIVSDTSTGVLRKTVKWYRSVRTVLPTLGGENWIAYRINEKDQAVGWSQTATGLERATIWFGDRPVQIDTLLDADSAGLEIHAAYAINDRGQIAAIQRLPNNRVEPLLLTPRHCQGS